MTSEDLQNLKDTLSLLIAKQKEVVASPKPTYSIDGQSVSWGDYYRMLSDQIEAVKTQIIQAEPYIFVTQAM